MKLVEVDKNNLPQGNVLAYSKRVAWLVGELRLTEFNTVECVHKHYNIGLDVVTHYCILEKPE
jgi:hypothetical protein